MVWEELAVLLLVCSLVPLLVFFEFTLIPVYVIVLT
jgi:hypothetical protein